MPHFAVIFCSCLFVFSWGGVVGVRQRSECYVLYDETAILNSTSWFIASHDAYGIFVRAYMTVMSVRLSGKGQRKGFSSAFKMSP